MTQLAIHNHHVIQYYNDLGDAAHEVGYYDEAIHFYARAQWEECLEELFHSNYFPSLRSFDTNSQTDTHPISKQSLLPTEDISF